MIAAEGGGGGGDDDDALDKSKHPLRQGVPTAPGSSISHVRGILGGLIESNSVVTAMSVVTIYALYGDDLRILAFDKSADTTFLVLSILAFALFLLEITLLCLCKRDYFAKPDWEDLLFTIGRWKLRKSTLSWLNEVRRAMQTGSFYFWLDLISTASLAVELPWAGQTSEAVLESIDSSVAGKASVAGARAANKLKIIRMVRLVRLVKLYKYFSAKQRAKSSGARASSATLSTTGSSLGEMSPPESHVGAEMSDRTTKKVILGILAMLLVIPLLQAEEVVYLNEFSMNALFASRLQLADSRDVDAGALEQQWEFAESLFINATTAVGVTYTGFDDGLPTSAAIPVDRTNAVDLRVEEQDVLAVTDPGIDASMTALFDVSAKLREEALLGTLLTSFVIVLLSLGMISFNRDVKKLVIVPIERMLLLVREISLNPLSLDLGSLEIDDKRNDGFETTLLLRTISKIAGLMRVGFGEAGAGIIGRNLSMVEGTDATMNLLGNGRKIDAIFGFCDVRQFTDTTECLQEEVMLFVNRIAHILHSIVVQCEGAANKNIGDAFLLTWKVKSGQQTASGEGGNYAADKALYAFVKTMIEMTKHEDFLCNFSPRALSALFERMPGYKCRIGCGLHFGSAIEGAIGSAKKIDATFVSHHVNMSETLESSTKEYGVSILMSQPFYELLSPEAKAGTRKVGSLKDDMPIYTYDVDLAADYSESRKKENTPKKRLQHHRKTAFSLVEHSDGNTAPRNRKTVLVRKGPLLASSDGQSNGLGDLPTIKISSNFPGVWNADKDVVRARARFSDEMRQEWLHGMSEYDGGNMDAAESHFLRVLALSADSDVPSKKMLARCKDARARPAH